MFEILNSNSAIVELFPNSGPGPKNLSSGDTTNGYFGVLQASELDLNGILIKKYIAEGIPTESIDPESTKATWHKFFIDSKVVYVPTEAFVQQVAYQRYSDLGFRSFSDQYEYTDWRKDFLGGSAQQQMLVIGEGSKKAVLGIRLGMPAMLTENTYDVANNYSNEYARTIARIFGEVGGIRYSTRYTPTQGMRSINTPLAWQTGTALTLPNYIPVAGIVSGSIGTALTSSTTAYEFVPVLELLTDENVTFSVVMDRLVSDDVSATETVATSPGAFTDPLPVWHTLKGDKLASESSTATSVPHRFFEAPDTPLLSAGACAESVSAYASIAGFEVTVEPGALVGGGMLISVKSAVPNIDGFSDTAAVVGLMAENSVRGLKVIIPANFTFIN